MEIRFNITLTDLVRFNLYHASRRVLTWVIIAIVAVLFATTLRGQQFPFGAWIFIIIVLALFSTAGYLLATALIALASYAPSKNRGVLGEHKLSFTATDVTEETTVSNGTWSWQSVPEVSRNRRYIFIYVQQNMAHIIPKRAFASRAEADRFYDAAASAWREASQRG